MQANSATANKFTGTKSPWDTHELGSGLPSARRDLKRSFKQGALVWKLPCVQRVHSSGHQHGLLGVIVCGYWHARLLFLSSCFVGIVPSCMRPVGLPLACLCASDKTEGLLQA